MDKWKVLRAIAQCMSDRRYMPTIAQRVPDQNITTLGVELEMITSFPDLSELDQVYSQMANLLNQKFLVDMPFSDQRYYAPSYRAQWHPAEEADLLKLKYDRERGDWYNKRRFCVKFEQINAMPENGRGVEIVTPIMRLGSYEHLVRGMLEAVSSCPLEISLTPACGLHVHVGRRGKFSADHLRRIAKAIVLFENEMDKFHPPWRQYSNMYTKSNRDMAHGFRKIAADLEASPENSQLVEVLDGLTKTNEVVTAMNGPAEIDKNFKYNFQSFANYGTVEFRQARATLDVPWVLAWIKIVAAFVEAAIYTEDEVFDQMAEDLDDVYDVKPCQFLGARTEMLKDFLALEDPQVFDAALWAGDENETTRYGRGEAN